MTACKVFHIFWTAFGVTPLFPVCSWFAQCEHGGLVHLLVHQCFSNGVQNNTSLQRAPATWWVVSPYSDKHSCVAERHKLKPRGNVSYSRFGRILLRSSDEAVLVRLSGCWEAIELGVGAQRAFSIISKLTAHRPQAHRVQGLIAILNISHHHAHSLGHQRFFVVVLNYYLFIKISVLKPRMLCIYRKVSDVYSKRFYNKAL